jgi:hypothetical protein
MKYSFRENKNHAAHASVSHGLQDTADGGINITFLAPTALSHALCINGIAWLPQASPKIIFPSSHAMGMTPDSTANFG